MGKNLWGDFQIIATQEQGMVTFSNFDILKNNLLENLKEYDLAFTNKADLEEAKLARDELKKVKKIIKEKKDELKKGYMLPYEKVEECLDTLMDMVKVPFGKIDDFIKAEELKQKEDNLKNFYSAKSEVLGEYAEKIINSPVFYNKKWNNISYKEKQCQEEITEKIKQAGIDINTIQTIGGKNTQVLLARYFETLSIDETIKFSKSLETESNFTEHIDVVEDGIIGYRVLKIYGTENQMIQIMNQMEILGLEVEEVEDGMPKEMEEITTPNFNSFVVFDIETSGTEGIGKGDAPAEITEIGAVKVVDGKIVDRFSMLANPGRKITPYNVRLTKITNEMVEKEPPVSEVIKAFYDFVGDSILVGHNIKGCDIHFIVEAAKRSKFTFENKFLDTKLLAGKFKEKMNWRYIKLEYLSEYFGIEQKEAHRAWCDAEANAELYLRLKEMYESESK